MPMSAQPAWVTDPALFDLKPGYTVAFLGCGNLGTAILGGILASLSDDSTDSKAGDDVPKPGKFIACVRSQASVTRIKSALGSNADKVTYAVKDNVASVKSANIIILGCKPFVFRELLAEEGLSDALSGKTLISILAGVTSNMTRAAVTAQDDHSFLCLRAMPSVAAMIRQSMTVIETSDFPIPETITNILNWLFTRVGQVEWLPSKNMDAVTALCGSGPAFAALAIEGLADGAVAMGIPRAQAIIMAAQTLKGAAELVLNGEHPALLREKVCTPGGCTIAGSLILEESGVRGQFALAVREATTVASRLGSGAVNVNGTKF